MNLLKTSLQHKYAQANILILGWGREGQSTYQVLRDIFPEKKLWVSDEKKINIDSFHDELLFVHQEYLNNLDQFDIIFKTPGIPLHETNLQQLYQQHKLTSQMSEFLAAYASQVIGVTGTKGKSTTASLIYHLLHENKRDALLVGNIGQPVFTAAEDILDETTVVVEMSSYQLETVNDSPHVAVLLNLFPEHLNYHQTLNKYQEAKANITRFQTTDDHLVYNIEDQHVVQIAASTKAVKHPFSPGNNLDQDDVVKTAAQKLPQVIQKFNLPAAIEVAKLEGLTGIEIAHAIDTFKTLPHRLENIGTFHDITFIDDTLATIPEAAVLALETYPETSVIVLGGYDRGIDYTPIVQKVIGAQIPTVLFFRPSGEKMAELLKQTSPPDKLPQIFFVENMEEAVRLAYQHAKPHSVVLLSPASPSHGQFKDYEDKSTQFSQYAHALAKEKIHSQ